MTRRCDVTLKDLLSDPLTKDVMAADQVDQQELEEMLTEIAVILKSRSRCRRRPRTWRNPYQK